MKQNKSRPIVLFTVALLWVGSTQAQESANTSGGEATGTGGTVAYSLGQALYSTHGVSGGSIAEGVQHAYEIYTVSLNEMNNNTSLSVYPIPTAEYLVLEIGDIKHEKLFYELYDLQGKLAISGKIMTRQTEINIANLSSGAYFIDVVTTEHKKIQSFKIIKN